MTANGYEQVYVRLRSKTTGEWFVHPDLRTMLVEEAEARETTLTDVVGFILAGRYKVPYSYGYGRSRAIQPNADVLNLRLPRDVWVAVRDEAARSGQRDYAVIRRVLCQHYGLT